MRVGRSSGELLRRVGMSRVQSAAKDFVVSSKLLNAPRKLDPLLELSSDHRLSLHENLLRMASRAEDEVDPDLISAWRSNWSARLIDDTLFDREPVRP